MADVAVIAPFLAATLILSVLWGQALRYLDERSPALRRWVFAAMAWTRWRSDAVRAAILSAVYCGLGLSAALLLALAFGLPLASLATLSPAHLGPIVLGIVAEISLTNLFGDLSCRLSGQGGPEQVAEIADIPWMKGLRQLPPVAVPIVAALAGAVEEVFFRGVLLLILTNKLRLSPSLAIALAGMLFLLEQLVQLRTPFQAMIIGGSCVAISLVGGLLVLQTNSVVPAALCHASFVIFFMSPSPGSAGR
jgi:membrane protease YdiL (CAAX protease family)